MVVGIPRLISELSSMMSLEAGDVLATGTPDGVGAPRGERLVGGDEVVVTSPQLGTIRNRVRLAAVLSRW
jgi:2-keto-4-pentenoate hydratase/2-oxohepta-3-ene-1,7-dioic acid hydratase in catechol pathway